jgi:steroid delta-isomerase-like uncharacterized protein
MTIPISQEEISMSVEKNKAIVGRYLEEIWNQGDLTAAEKTLTAIFAFHSPTGTIEGLEAFKKYVGGVRTVFPDLHFATEALVAEGDQVVAQWTMTGTQKADFMGIPASGKNFAVPGVSRLTFSAGKLAEAHVFWDRLSLLDQLRATPHAG